MNQAADTAVEIPIRAYLDKVAAALHGPRRQRTRILTELHDGLEQAITDRTTRGQPAERATATVIAEFGTPDAVAAAFAGELATGFARRTLSTYIATGPLVGIWWLLLLRPDPWRAGLVALLTAIPVVPLIAVGLATAAGTLATTGRLMRWLPEAGPGRALTATATVTGLTLVGDLLIIGVAAHAAALTRPLAVIAVAASLIRVGCSLRILAQARALRHRLPR